jgi:GNAT superfamily N-acetyltransferase
MSALALAIRPPSSADEVTAALALVHSALAPTWRFGDRALERTLADMLLAFDGPHVIGVVVLSAGVLPAVRLVAVRPDARRQGVGSALVRAACDELHGRGALRAYAGGITGLWAGIPLDLPGAVDFFTATGWQIQGTVYDLTRSLLDFATPPEITERAAVAGVTFGLASLDERDCLVAHGHEHWPALWRDEFATAAPRNILVGRRDGRLVAALLMGYPGEVESLQPLLGPGITTIGCVGTLTEVRGLGIGTALVGAASERLRDAGGVACRIDWTSLLTFYGRLGYTPWRSYASGWRTLEAGQR